jgi:hypothetical protein
LDLEADNAIIKTREKANEVPLVSTDCATNTLIGKISIRVPRVVKGLKNKWWERERKRNVVTIKVLNLPIVAVSSFYDAVFFYVLTYTIDYRRVS